jgi:exonuclease SbcD
LKSSAAPARYAGSLVQLDFGETEPSKSVFLVDAEPGAPAQVRQLSIAAGRKLVSIRGPIEQLAAAAQPAGDAYLRVVVQTDGPVPGMGDRIREMLPNAVAVSLEYERGELEEPAVPVLTLQPRDQFLSYYREAHAVEPHASLVAAFEEVLELEQGPQ